MGNKAGKEKKSKKGSTKKEPKKKTATKVNKGASKSKKEPQTAPKKEEEKQSSSNSPYDAVCGASDIMTLYELSTFVGKPHSKKVNDLLCSNLDFILKDPNDGLSRNYKQIVSNFSEMLEEETGTEYYKYYAFYALDFILFRAKWDRNTFKDILTWMESMVVSAENSIEMPRLSFSYIYGLEACYLMMKRGQNNEDIPTFILQQFEGYNFKDWTVDQRRIIANLIKKAKCNNKYCYVALSYYYVNCGQCEDTNYSKALYFANKTTFSTKRKDYSQWIESELVRKKKKSNDEIKRYEERYLENKNKFDIKENNANISQDDLVRLGKCYANADDYEKGLVMFEENIRWYDSYNKFDEYKHPYDDERIKQKKLVYLFNFGYDFEDYEKWDKIIFEEFSKVYFFYYLPDSIRSDPVCDNELMGEYRKKRSVWLEREKYKYKKKFDDKCKTHSFLYPFADVKKTMEALKDWSEDEEYTNKYIYNMNELLDIIYAGCDKLSENNINIMLIDKEDGSTDSSKPLFWDTFISVWYVLIGRFNNNTDSIKMYKKDLVESIWCKFHGPVFKYLQNNMTDEKITDIVLNRLNELWQRNKQHNDSLGDAYFKKMINKIIEIATSENKSNNVLNTSGYDECDDEKKENINAKDIFEAKVRILKWLDKDRDSWLNSRGTGLKRQQVMSEIKSKYEFALDVLGQALTNYYKNELFLDSNYSFVTDICIDEKELILRQDKKDILGRVRWGPIGNDGINEERYKEAMNGYKFAISEKLKSFKDVYVEFLLKVGNKLQETFQKDMKELFADTNGEYCQAPVKKFERCLQKINFDYKDEKKPAGAHILDIVRCLVVYENINDLVNGYKKLIGKYKVCRLKNNFIKDAQVFGNYRCLMVNILYQHPTNEKLRMICEVQLTVRKVYNVRLTMHKNYKLFRAILPEDDALLF